MLKRKFVVFVHVCAVPFEHPLRNEMKRKFGVCAGESAPAPTVTQSVPGKARAKALLRDLIALPFCARTQYLRCVRRTGSGTENWARAEQGARQGL